METDLNFCLQTHLACAYAGREGFCALSYCKKVRDDIPERMQRRRETEKENERRL